MRAWLLGLVVLPALVSGCGRTEESAPGEPFPSPVCGGIKIKIEGALPCDRVVEIALGALRDRAPEQLARGATAVEVFLANCPRDEIPQQIDCGSEPFAQLVTVTFASTPGGGPIERTLTVAVAPVTGRVLGIANPLIR
jgi:hypothetical protein